jgi:hypothetical protein
VYLQGRLLEPVLGLGVLVFLVDGVEDRGVEVVAGFHETVTQVGVLVELEVTYLCTNQKKLTPKLSTMHYLPQPQYHDPSPKHNDNNRPFPASNPIYSYTTNDTSPHPLHPWYFWIRRRCFGPLLCRPRAIIPTIPPMVHSRNNDSDRVRKHAVPQLSL